MKPHGKRVRIVSQSRSVSGVDCLAVRMSTAETYKQLNKIKQIVVAITSKLHDLHLSVELQLAPLRHHVYVVSTVSSFSVAAPGVSSTITNLLYLSARWHTTLINVKLINNVIRYPYVECWPE